jgi:hypothetical protein
VTLQFGKSMKTNLTDNNRYKVCWTKPKAKNGFYSQQEVVVFGLDNVQHIIEHVIPKGQGWDVIPM